MKLIASGLEGLKIKLRENSLAAIDLKVYILWEQSIDQMSDSTFLGLKLSSVEKKYHKIGILKLSFRLYQNIFSADYTPY